MIEKSLAMPFIIGNLLAVVPLKEDFSNSVSRYTKLGNTS